MLFQKFLKKKRLMGKKRRVHKKSNTRLVKDRNKKLKNQN
jgi:hypothetical protein